MNRYGISCLRLSGYRLLFIILTGVFISATSSGISVMSDESATTIARQLIDQSGIGGGLIVHLGSGEGSLTPALRIRENFIVHGLERDPVKVEQSRIHLLYQGLYGPVSINHWCGEHLPYAENLVNLIIAEDASGVEMYEIMRVLAPLGVALVREHGKWTKTVKPWPEEIDEWTHYLHGPGNNAVADDRLVGLPKRLQWVNPPRWSRSHEHLGNLSAAVSSGGRLFYIMDKGPTADVTMPPEWTLIARDAFNGVLLWERSMGEWEFRLRGFRSGPPDLARRLVSAGDFVYVTLGYGEPVVALDGVTGETIHIYDQTRNTQEIIFADGVLYLVIGEEAPDNNIHKKNKGYLSSYQKRRPHTQLMAVDASTGRILWLKSGNGVENILPTTLAVSGGRVFFQNTQQIICMESTTGVELWRTGRPVERDRQSWSTPTLVVYDGVVLSADREVLDSDCDDEDMGVKWTVASRIDASPAGEIIAFSADTGESLWSAPCRENFMAPVDILIADGLVWTGNLIRRSDPGILEGRDVYTGEVRRTRQSDLEFYDPIMSHSRCYRNKATNNYLITARSGVEFHDIESGTAVANHWVRGECQYGVIPANGLLYAPPHPCACFILAKLNSFHALSSGIGYSDKPWSGDRLVKGEAYMNVESKTEGSDDWLTYRHDASRSGRTSATVSSALSKDWEIELAAPLTAPVAAAGRVYVASRETHTLYSLDSGNGVEHWHFTAGGRIDSPPTIWNGHVFFGSADGWIYCLRATDGNLVWRYLAAPNERLVGVDGQLESTWPVHGSVMVLPSSNPSKGVLYATAGRSGYLDGGIVMVRLDAGSGVEFSRTVIDNRDDIDEYGHPLMQPTSGWSMPGALNDILSARNNSVFMRHLRFNMDGEPQVDTEPHLHSPAGFLDDSWWHRTYWMAGDKMDSGFGYWPMMGNLVPSGRLLVLDGKNTYGYGRDRYHAQGSHVGLGMAEYRLFSQSRFVDPRRHAEKEVFPWEKHIELYVRAMLLADRILFVAGPDDPLADQDPVAVWEGRTGGILLAVCADTGEKLAEYILDSPPVFDSLIAISGRIFFTSTDGRVVSYTSQSADNTF